MSFPSLLHDAGRDAALALRQLRNRPGFAVAAILTLALGIGAPTAIFSIVHAVLLRPLPYPDADRVVRFRIESQSPRGSIAFDALDVGMALEWGASSSTLAALAIYNDAARTVSTTDGPVRLTGIAATPNLFDVLGTRPFAGRIFGGADRDTQQVVLSYRTWQRQFAGNSDVVGSLISLDGRPHRVTGVMPEGFDFPTPETAFWIPVLLSTGGTRGMILPAIGRLLPDATVGGVAEEGQRHLDDGLRGERRTMVVRTLQDQMVGPVRRTLWLFMAAVGLVSIVATVNISLLILTRSAGRAREFTLRLALGAGRARLIRQVCTEGLVLAAIGGHAGLLLAAGTLSVLVSIAPPEVPRLHETGFDPAVLLFSAVLTIGASLIFGVLSAGRIAGDDGVRVPAGVPRRRLHGLASAELAFAVVLLVTAALLLRSFVGVVLVEQGFDPSNRAVMQVTLPSARYPSPDARMDFLVRLLDRLRQVPGIRTVGVTTSMPNRQPTGRFAYDPVGLDPFADPWTMKLTEVRMVSEGFLEAMGIPVVAGRIFDAADVDGAEPVIVISKAFERVHFPDGDAIGRMLYSGSGDRRVIGIVGDIRPATTGLPQYDPSTYLPLRQSVNVFEQFATVTIAVHGDAVDGLITHARALTRSLDPELPLFNVRTLDDEVAGLVAGPRFSAAVIALFAVVALVMAALGVYGVMAYAATQRTREIGIRVALGATRSQVIRLMVRDGVMVVGAGLVPGLVAALWLSRSLTGLLLDVAPADPAAVGVMAGVLAVTGLVAVYLPARRATRVSVVTALREE